MVKRRYQNETIPLRATGAETVIRVNPVPNLALSNRDSFVIQPSRGCRSQDCDRKISVVIRGQG